MKFAIISNITKDPDGLYLNKVKRETEESGGSVSFTGNLKMDGNMTDVLESNPDMILAMGGDGTFLNVAGLTSRSGIPILGINIGSMGFLSGTEVSDTKKAIEMIIAGKYGISSRMMARAVVKREHKDVADAVALNDIVISRGLLSRIVNIETYIDENYTDTFPGDGVIVSTPTGSTGYSLSAGGPVIDHGLELMVITPICPHIMHARPFVTGAGSSIKLIVRENSDYKCTLTADGQKGIELFGGDEVLVTRGPDDIKLVAIGQNNLYTTLREKIYFRKAVHR